MLLVACDSICTPKAQSKHVAELTGHLNRAAGPMDAEPVALPGHHGEAVAAPFRARGVIPIPAYSWRLIQALAKDPDLNLKGHML